MIHKKVSELQVGDLVDLEHDPFADSEKHPEFEFELQEVEAIEVETPQCTAVYFASAPCIGFPPDHIVKVGA